MRTCPYPVVEASGSCCRSAPCDLEWHRPCDALGGCPDRATCGDCAEPVVSRTTVERAYHDGVADERQRIVGELRAISRLSAEHHNTAGSMISTAAKSLANMIDAGRVSAPVRTV